MTRCGDRSQQKSSRSGRLGQGARGAGLLCVLVFIIVVLIVWLLVTSLLLLLSPSPRDDAATPCSSPGPATMSDAAGARPLGVYCYSPSAGSGCRGRGDLHKVKDNQTLCCTDLKQHVEDFFKAELASRLTVDTIKEVKLNQVKKASSAVHRDPSASRLRPAAHLTVLTKKLTKTGGDPSVIQWERGGPTSFLQGLQHGGDHVKVVTAGYYYVYAGLQFHVDPATVDTHAIVAYLYKNFHSGDEKRKLMTARESSCDGTRDVSGPVSVHLAGVYKLQAGDNISVYADQAPILDRSPAASYLGLYLI